jgi:hypothetical protein
LAFLNLAQPIHKNHRTDESLMRKIGTILAYSRGMESRKISIGGRGIFMIIRLTCHIRIE